MQDRALTSDRYFSFKIQNRCILKGFFSVLNAAMAKGGIGQ